MYDFKDVPNLLVHTCFIEMNWKFCYLYVALEIPRQLIDDVCEYGHDNNFA